MLTAASLCGELDAAGQERLQLLLDRSPEWHAMMDRYRSVQSLLDLVPRQELEEALHAGRTKGLGFSGRTRPLLLAAAAILLGAVGLAAVFLGLPEQSSRSLAFPHGRCSSGGKVLRTGAGVGSSLESGADSFCDVQIRDGGRVALRIFPNSRVRFNSETDALHLAVDRGRMLIDAGKRRERGLAVHTPGHTVQIMGTRLIVSYESPESVDVEVLDGRAQVRSALFQELPRLQRRLPEGARAAAAKEVPALFAQKVTVLETGHRLHLLRQGLSGRDREQLRAALNRAYGNFAFRGAKGPEQVAEIVTLARSVLEDPKLRTRLEQSRLDSEVRAVSPRRRWQLERRFQGLTGGGHSIATAEQSRGPGPGAVKVRPADPASILRALQEERPSKLLYRIHLRDGKVLTGIVEQEGANYRLTTELGDIIIQRNRVKSLELYLEE